jgi:hypothetical protein
MRNKTHRRIPAKEVNRPRSAELDAILYSFVPNRPEHKHHLVVVRFDFTKLTAVSPRRR